MNCRLAEGCRYLGLSFFLLLATMTGMAVSSPKTKTVIIVSRVPPPTISLPKWARRKLTGITPATVARLNRHQEMAVSPAT